MVYQSIIGGGSGGSGTVTSVALSMPAIMTVSGSPVTTTGTLAGTLATQSANVVWAGPTTGAAAAPTFRALSHADLGTGGGGATKYLREDMTWVAVSASPGGATTQVQFNDAGSFNGDSGLVWNNTEKTLSVGSSSTTVAALTVTKGGNGNMGAFYVSSSSTSATHTTASITNSGAGFGLIVSNSSAGIPAIRVMANANRTSSGLVEIICAAGSGAANQDAISMYSSISGSGVANATIGIRMAAESSTTVDQDAGRILSGFSIATHASRTSYIAFQTVNSASALTERFRINGTGLLASVVATTNTNTVGTTGTTILNSSGIPAAGYGLNHIWYLKSSTTDSQEAASFSVIWLEATHASRGASISFSTVWNAGALTERLTIGDSGWLQSTQQTASTNGIAGSISIRTNSTGTPAAGFGSQIEFRLKSSTTENTVAAILLVKWTTATHASRTSEMLSRVTYNGSTNTVLRVYNDGIDITSINTGIGKLLMEGTQVLQTRRTGWAAATGSATRTAFDTTTVTTAQLAERVKALLDDLITHGLIGA